MMVLVKKNLFLLLIPISSITYGILTRKYHQMTITRIRVEMHSA